MAKSFLDCVIAALKGDPGNENAVPYINGGSPALVMKTGTASLVSGAATIATGLDSVSFFQAGISGATGFGTGATEVNDIFVSSITTGSVVVKGIFNNFATGSAQISVSGTGGFNWVAIGPLKV